MAAKNAKKIVQYEHHGVMVSVYERLKGKHWTPCLCAVCEKFKPNDRENNCHIANELYELDVKHHLVTPVWECPEFVLTGE